MAEDWLQRFLDSETRPATSATERTQAKEVYIRYKRWAEEAKEYVQSERKFNEAMEGHDVESSKTNNKKFYHLVLKDRLAMFAERHGMGNETMPSPEEVEGVL
jgi:phage/plasmid-associated DNA primase